MFNYKRRRASGMRNAHISHFRAEEFIYLSEERNGSLLTLRPSDRYIWLCHIYTLYIARFTAYTVERVDTKDPGQKPGPFATFFSISSRASGTPGRATRSAAPAR